MRQIYSLQNQRTITGESIRVRSHGALPVEVQWRGCRFAVASVDAMWCVEGKWWLDVGCSGDARCYFRLHLHDRTTRTICVEIFCSPAGGWRLWRVAD